MKAAKGTINEALAQVASYNREQQPLAEATMSKKQSLEDFTQSTTGMKADLASKCTANVPLICSKWMYFFKAFLG